MLHDTFLHHLAGKAAVEKPGLDRAAINLEQIRALRRGGCTGPLSL